MGLVAIYPKPNLCKRPPECLQRRLDLDVSVRATTLSSA
jgi:hypothetical protein